ncbi:hypothetical protein HanRHA438_Chr06g0283111 [Helianthus annuus]|nr:hypothetical protein HanRHA438_Chr06g0283111 [Helianthus annuus]
MLVDEPEEDEIEADVERDQDQMSPETEHLLKDIDYGLETEKAGGEEGDDERKSSSHSDSEVDETEHWKKVMSDKEKHKKRKRSGDDNDDLYIPSPEHVQEVQTPPSSRGRKKSNSRKHVKSPAARRLKILLKSKPIQEPSQPPSTPPEPQQQSSPKQPSPPPEPQQQSSPKQPTPPHQPSPPQSLPQLHISTPTNEQPVVTSPHILQTPPTSQPPVQTTPGSSGFKDFPNVPENIPLEDIGDFSFVNGEHVKKLQQKVDEVLIEKKKLEKRVKRVEADQDDIDILKVRIAELEEEKARRDEQNENFKLKNKELEATNAKKEHEMYMMNKVLENLIGKPVEQRFEEIELEEVRARRKAEIEAEMQNKGKGVQVEGVIEVTERAVVPSIVSESPIQNPCPIYSVSGVFNDDVIDDIVDDDVEDDDEEDDEEEDDDEVRKDYADDVFSASHDYDDGYDDDNQGGTGIKVTEVTTEENVDDYLHDDANEEPEDAESEGEPDDTKNVDDSDDHVSRLILRLEHGVEEGEILHTYMLGEYLEMSHIDENNFNFDFEEELNQFDIN